LQRGRLSAKLKTPIVAATAAAVGNGSGNER
jgi:hypothetical protein